MRLGRSDQSLLFQNLERGLWVSGGEVRRRKEAHGLNVSSYMRHVNLGRWELSSDTLPRLPFHRDEKVTLQLETNKSEMLFCNKG
jgi:hypothetical protein